MSTDISNRSRVRKGVSEGGRFAVENRAEPHGVALAVRKPHDSLEVAKLAGLRARYPEASEEQIAESANGLREAKVLGDSAVLAEIERQATVTEHGERFVWDVNRNIVEGGSPMANSYQRDVDAAVRDALEASGADFPNSYMDDGELVVHTYLAGRVPVSADEDGRLLIGSGDGSWKGAGRGQSDTQLWNQELARRVDFAAVDRTFGVHAKRGDIEGRFDEETGEARYRWSNGFDQVDFKSTPGAPLEIHPDTADSARAAFLNDFTWPGSVAPMAKIEQDATQAREMMIWHSDMDHARFKHRDGGIRDMHEARRHKYRTVDRIEAEMPGSSPGSGGGSARITTSTDGWYAEARIDADGTEHFIVDGRPVDGPQPGKHKQKKLAEVFAKNRKDLHAMAVASYHGLNA